MRFVLVNNIPSVLLMSLVLLASAQRTSNNLRDADVHELARQNKITKQILEAFIQKKLGLSKGYVRPPSIQDIIPMKMVQEKRVMNQPLEEEQTTETQEYPEDDGLQSVESEQIDSIYGEECTSCNDDDLGVTRWTMPLLKSGEKRYYLGIFFKANWFKAQQYCRFHGMHLASISSQQENDKLEQYVKDSGYGREHFWTSGTDLAEEGNFFWMANGRPLTFVNWNAGEPNNFRYENGEEENCLELWNRDDKGLKWNDSPCSFETFFICEVRTD
ncbi:CD209 antigen-like protein C isoform X1 [Ostrinia nubilalis]|uniref:CD209 antigen-like protein C isoform X3 n=1 Tax=Ostrinia furnacalis TaxID=93504 RepID=UPI00103CD157|nr:CD209 antigen-like protein C isoform X3 [Ostrinia furnacalis]XP_028168534.1 CD209 antigen-like protein C isoform X4 [Ostrinia furnacalis]